MRDIVAFSALAVLIAVIFATQGTVYTLRMLVEAGCYAILALGLTIQWGYAGIFNIGIMGFIAAAGAVSMLISFPLNAAFWEGQGPALIAVFVLKLALGALLIFAANRADRLFGAGPRLKTLCITIAIATTFIMVTSHMEGMAVTIETEADWIGGLGLPVFLGWLAGGLVAGAIAFVVGRICLGLRADYLAIATLGIAQIIKTFLRNADWLTRGTLTVSPLPWPVPAPADGEFALARAAYLSVVAILIAVFYLALQRAWHAPWGRMMRAIRDNETAAEAIGKNVDRRRLEIFVLGSVLMGIGGAALVHFNAIYDPSGFIDLSHTFLIWVMVILGGSGNNRGAIFGALFVYIVWTMSQPIALWVFDMVRIYGDHWFGWQAPSDFDSRALQMRVFVIGLTITLVLRYLPQGVLPEPDARKSGIKE